MEQELLKSVVQSGGASREWETRRFIGSLKEPERAAAASKALAEEQARSDRIKEASAQDRLEGYLGYIERKKAAADRALLPADDEDLREQVRRLREKDSKSARTT